MKLRTILMAAFAALVLAGCSNSDDSGIAGDKGKSGKTATVEIKISQAVDTPKTRAEVDETATADEKTIKSGAIYSFTEVGILETVLEFTDADLNGVTLEMECGVGQRRFYALINPPAGLTPPSTLTPATTIYDFEKFVVEVADMASLTSATDGFFMTNLAKPELETLAADVVNNVTITIGRATAKLNVAYIADTKTNGEPNGTLRDVDYKLKSTPNNMYLTSVYENGIFKTPNYGITYDADNFIISASNEVPSTYIDAIDDEANCFYMTENAAPAGQLRQGQLNYVVIRGTYTPTENYVDADGKLITPPATAVTFWRKTAIDAAGKFVKFLDEKCYSVKPADGTYDATTIRFEEYTDGVCYYPFVIRGNGTDANDPASYDVVRNYLYKAQIIVVNGPGWWSEDATDNGGGELGGETEMVVTFDVVDWTPGVTQEGGI